MNVIEHCTEDYIFVFGSNEAGIHGAGAAKTAHEQYGAVWGCGYGLQGQSFAIPTKDRYIQTLPLDAIESYVKKFLIFARSNPDLKFFITPFGCGLAGYKRTQIGPMLNNIPSNCYFASTWLEKD